MFNARPHLMISAKLRQLVDGARLNRKSDLSRVSASRQAGSRPSAGERAEFLPFCRPSIDATDIAAVVQVLESGWITTGAKVQKLEQQMSASTGCKYAVAVSSATAGMHLMLHALEVGPGDEVITPSLTWVSTINLITLCGATPVFVDVDRDTLMTSREQIERAITPRTKMIIPVHYAGAPLDLEPIRELAEKHEIPLVEDAAHALGSTYHDVPVGHTGNAIFSLQAIKNVTTAEGGVICTDDQNLAARLRRLRFHGLGSDAFDRQEQGRAANAEVLEPGYKYNLPDMNACLGLGQLDRLQQLNQKRADLAAMYLRAFDNIEAISPLGLPEYVHGHAWHLFIIRVDTALLKISRDHFMKDLNSKQIGTGIHFKAVHQHKFYRDSLPGTPKDLDNSTWNSDRILTLPLFPGMQAADVDRVVSSIEEIVARARR